jgi:arylsulfatase A-like enzyme
MLKGAIHYQGLVRVPFIWFDPHDPAGGRRSSDLLGTIDIASTVLDRAGLGGFNGMQGRSMLPAIANADPQPRARFLIEEESSRLQMGFAERIRLRTVVTDRYRLSTYAGVPWGELYDLREDPDEDINRWNDPAYGGVQMELLFDLAQAALDVSETSPHPTYRA